VNDALQKVMRSDSTTLTIAHRLATVRRADWIIVLSSEGEVAEQGTYAQLSKKPNGAFNKLMRMQMEGQAEPPPECKDGIIYEEAEREEKEEQALKEEEEARLEEREVTEQKEKGTTIID
jgi:putative ABC transport system ATP-binding protein